MTREELERWLDGASLAAGLAIAAAHRPGVLANLERLAGMAELVDEFELPAEVDPAPRFEA